MGHPLIETERVGLTDSIKVCSRKGDAASGRMCEVRDRLCHLRGRMYGGPTSGEPCSRSRPAWRRPGAINFGGATPG